MNRNTADEGTISWQSPSNIALVKYWGKHGNQLPQNPSLSMTLQASYTTTSVFYTKRKNPGNEVKFRFLFEEKPDRTFEQRIAAYLNKLLPENSFLAAYDMVIESGNTFPHSSGIASSAAAFSALALCVMSLKQITGKKQGESAFFREASRMARLGSGSACRSVYGGYTVWGEVSRGSHYSDEYAIPLLTEVHPVFRSFYDAILIVSAQKKKVGSSAGHALMEQHPFAQNRFRQANEHTNELIGVLKSGDLARYIEIVENEALTLHGLMMSSTPGFILMKKETTEIIEKIREFRKTKNIPVAFTLDAGPNVHVLYPAMHRNKVKRFISDELEKLCAGKRWIDDSLGAGPKQLTG